MSGRTNVVIFDFDGTIADTFRLVVGIFEDVVRGKVPITQSELDNLRKIGLSARWAQELGIPLWRAPFLLAKGRRKMRRRMQHIEVFDGMQAVLRRLHDDTDTVLIVMSSNTATTINGFLRRKDLDLYFSQVIGGAGLFKKARILKKLVERNQLDPATTYYVGDEVRDIEAANKAGLKAIGVTWGFNDRALLERHGAFALVDTPAELGEVLGLDPTRHEPAGAHPDKANGGAHAA